MVIYIQLYRAIAKEQIEGKWVKGSELLERDRERGGEVGHFIEKGKSGVAQLASTICRTILNFWR